MLDDDVLGFGCTVLNSQGEKNFDNKFSPGAMMAFVERKVATLNKAGHKIAIAGMDPSWVAGKQKHDCDTFKLNSHTNVCVYIAAPASIPNSVCYDLPCMEDKDFVLKIIREGFRSCRFTGIGYHSPTQGKSGTGGMTKFYQDQAAIRTNNEAFVARWPAVSQIDEREQEVPGVLVKFQALHPSVADAATLRALLPREEDVLTLRNGRTFANYRPFNGSDAHDVAPPLAKKQRKD
jgi:hypothetical protein